MPTPYSQTTTRSGAQTEQVRGGTRLPSDALSRKWRIAQPSENYTVHDLMMMVNKVRHDINQILTGSVLANSTVGSELKRTYNSRLNSIADNFAMLFSFKQGASRGTYKSGHAWKLESLRKSLESLKTTRGASEEDREAVGRCIRYVAALRETCRPLSEQCVHL